MKTVVHLFGFNLMVIMIIGLWRAWDGQDVDIARIPLPEYAWQAFLLFLSWAALVVAALAWR